MAGLAARAGSSPSVPLLTPRKVEVVAIGVSTGGPPVLNTIFRELPAAFPAPILVVQHIAAGFIEGMAQWLGRMSDLAVHIAKQGERPCAGHVYLAPDGVQMGVSPHGDIHLVAAPPENNACPSVSHLFRSVAQVHAARAIGVLLTGMGKDGARELKELKDRGAVTIAQDCASSVVHGMPGEAIAIGAASHVMSPPEIAAALRALAARQER
jgi:two-component system chemotaxis response regulator CheB